MNQSWGTAEPWKQSESFKDQVVYVTLETLRISAILLQPVMPDAMTRMLNALAIPQDERLFKDAVIKQYRHAIQRGCKLFIKSSH